MDKDQNTIQKTLISNSPNLNELKLNFKAFAVSCQRTNKKLSFLEQWQIFKNEFMESPNSRLETLNQEIDFVQNYKTKYNINILTPLDSEFPRRWLELENPPCPIYIMGDFLPDLKSFAIVGRREARTYTLNWMQEELPKLFQNHKLNIISGGARGVDQKAHELAILNGQRTTYILPSGLLNPYPESLKGKMRTLVNEGACFISTYFPTTEMQKGHFSSRNYLIAALTKHILVIEAQTRSGTAKTAKYGLEIGAEIAALPSFPTDLNYSESLKLIQEGAHLIKNYKDLEVFLKLT